MALTIWVLSAVEQRVAVNQDSHERHARRVTARGETENGI